MLIELQFSSLSIFPWRSDLVSALNIGIAETNGLINDANQEIELKLMKKQAENAWIKREKKGFFDLNPALVSIEKSKSRSQSTDNDQPKILYKGADSIRPSISRSLSAQRMSLELTPANETQLDNKSELSQSGNPRDALSGSFESKLSTSNLSKECLTDTLEANQKEITADNSTSRLDNSFFDFTLHGQVDFVPAENMYIVLGLRVVATLCETDTAAAHSQTLFFLIDKKCVEDLSISMMEYPDYENFYSSVENVLTDWGIDRELDIEFNESFLISLPPLEKGTYSDRILFSVEGTVYNIPSVVPKGFGGSEDIAERLNGLLTFIANRKISVERLQKKERNIVQKLVKEDYEDEDEQEEANDLEKVCVEERVFNLELLGDITNSEMIKPGGLQNPIYTLQTGIPPCDKSDIWNRSQNERFTSNLCRKAFKDIISPLNKSFAPLDLFRRGRNAPNCVTSSASAGSPEGVVRVRAVTSSKDITGSDKRKTSLASLLGCPIGCSRTLIFPPVLEGEDVRPGSDKVGPMELLAVLLECSVYCDFQLASVKVPLSSIINKPPAVVVMKSHHIANEDTLRNALLFNYKSAADLLINIGSSGVMGGLEGIKSAVQNDSMKFDLPSPGLRGGQFFFGNPPEGTPTASFLIDARVAAGPDLLEIKKANSAPLYNWELANLFRSLRGQHSSAEERGSVSLSTRVVSHILLALIFVIRDTTTFFRWVYPLHNIAWLTAATFLVYKVFNLINNGDRSDEFIIYMIRGGMSAQVPAEVSILSSGTNSFYAVHRPRVSNCYGTYRQMIEWGLLAIIFIRILRYFISVLQLSHKHHNMRNSACLRRFGVQSRIARGTFFKSLNSGLDCVSGAPFFMHRRSTGSKYSQSPKDISSLSLSKSFNTNERDVTIGKVLKIAPKLRVTRESIGMVTIPSPYLDMRVGWRVGQWFERISTCATVLEALFLLSPAYCGIMTGIIAQQDALCGDAESPMAPAFEIIGEELMGDSIGRTAGLEMLHYVPDSVSLLVGEQLMLLGRVLNMPPFPFRRVVIVTLGLIALSVLNLSALFTPLLQLLVYFPISYGFISIFINFIARIIFCCIYLCCVALSWLKQVPRFPSKNDVLPLSIVTSALWGTHHQLLSSMKRSIELFPWLETPAGEEDFFVSIIIEGVRTLINLLHIRLVSPLRIVIIVLIGSLGPIVIAFPLIRFFHRLSHARLVFRKKVNMQLGTLGLACSSFIITLFTLFDIVLSSLQIFLPLRMKLAVAVPHPMLYTGFVVSKAEEDRLLVWQPTKRDREEVFTCCASASEQLHTEENILCVNEKAMEYCSGVAMQKYLQGYNLESYRNVYTAKVPLIVVAGQATVQRTFRFVPMRAGKKERSGTSWTDLFLHPYHEYCSTAASKMLQVKHTCDQRGADLPPVIEEQHQSKASHPRARNHDSSSDSSSSIDEINDIIYRFPLLEVFEKFKMGWLINFFNRKSKDSLSAASAHLRFCKRRDNDGYLTSLFREFNWLYFALQRHRPYDFENDCFQFRSLIIVRAYSLADFYTRQFVARQRVKVAKQMSQPTQRRGAVN